MIYVILGLFLFYVGVEGPMDKCGNLAMKEYKIHLLDNDDTNNICDGSVAYTDEGFPIVPGMEFCGCTFHDTLEIFVNEECDYTATIDHELNHARKALRYWGRC